MVGGRPLEISVCATELHSGWGCECVGQVVGLRGGEGGGGVLDEGQPQQEACQFHTEREKKQRDIKKNKASGRRTDGQKDERTDGRTESGTGARGPLEQSFSSGVWTLRWHRSGAAR